ncbi:MAG: helix-turn-helix domain-containing protein [Treponema sp.]|jgi:transcriptional regulator with XRE-family HTH domain|nr:helix-turn-helix domain-containing protein [Treponema sp.]
MESLGEKLKSTRMEKGLTIDQVSRETNITARYIEALETENFNVFPGEPYVIGFIRNYSSFLDLDVQKTVGLYRTLKIQEQPVPVEQLLRHPPRMPSFLIPAILILAVVGLSGWGVYNLIINRKQNTVSSTNVRIPAEYMMEGNSMERRFYKNDAVLIPLDSNMYKLELFNIGETVTIRTPGGSVILDLSQEANIDLNNNGVPELRVTVADFAKNNPDMGALLHFFMMDSVAVFDAATVDTEQAVPFTINTVSSVSQTIIPASVSAYPFTLQTVSQGYSMFRWEVLNERDRREKSQHYFQRGDERSVQAQNGIRIWTSNAQAARFQVIGGGRTYPVELGGAGEVVVADIRWVRDDNNQYRLVLIRLESGS